jgi:DNA-directed RNA polymerase subunit RPC12/RpoP
MLRMESPYIMSKSKYVTQVCTSCGRESKMEIIGAVVGAENKVWYRCTRCHHSMMLDSAAKIKEDNTITYNREECVNYSPEKVFSVGASIYHTDWDDMGKVTSKEKDIERRQFHLGAVRKERDKEIDREFTIS